jgi:hypothetical protein
VRERRGALGRASEIAGNVMAGVRRRQQARAPKVLLYDPDGRPRTLDADSDAALRLLDTAQEMIALAGPPQAEQPGEDPLHGGDAA